MVLVCLMRNLARRVGRQRLNSLVCCADSFDRDQVMSDIDYRSLDAADRRILAEVQRDLRRSPEAIAEAAGMSVSSLRRRIARLRAEGIIAREVALVDASQLGIEIIVSVTMLEEQSDGYDRFKRRMLADDAVTQCYSVTGEADLILHVIMPDMQRFERWINEEILADGSVRRCTSNVVYSRIKFETAIPV